MKANTNLATKIGADLGFSSGHCSDCFFYLLLKKWVIGRELRMIENRDKNESQEGVGVTNSEYCQKQFHYYNNFQLNRVKTLEK